MYQLFPESDINTVSSKLGDTQEVSIGIRLKEEIFGGLNVG